MAKLTSKKALTPIMIIGSAIAVLLLLYMTKPRTEEIAAKERVWTVDAVKASLKSQTPSLQLYGSIESPRHSTLKAGVEADVNKKLIDEGDSVSKDALLIELDNRDAKLVLKQRQAEVQALNAQISAEHVRHEADKQALIHEKELFDLQKKDVARKYRLYQSKTGSAANYDEAKRLLAQQNLSLTTRQREIDDHKNRLSHLQAQQIKAQALASQAQINVERTQIRAPFDGKISKIFVAVGNRVRPGDSLIEVFDPKAIEVRTQIPLQYMAIIRQAVNDESQLTAYAFIGNVPITMTLDRLASKVEQGRSGVDALFAINKNFDLLELGKALSLIIKLPPIENVIALPAPALVGGNRIYKVVNNRLKAVDVIKHGNMINTDGSQSILISSDSIREGDLIMTTRLPHAIEGLKVQVSEDK